MIERGVSRGIRHPEFIEPYREPEIRDDDAGFELPPDLDMMLEAETRPGRSPFRSDWERSRLVSL